MKRKIVFIIIGILSGIYQINAQEVSSNTVTSKRAWEFGVGGTVFQFSRVSFSNFNHLDKGYTFDLTLDHAVWGGNLYIARELNKYFYLDFQGNAGFTDAATNGRKWLFMGGLGLQWRFGEYFNSGNIDPFLRVGGNYMHKGFNMMYTGTEGLGNNEMSWILENFNNKEGANRKNMVPVSIGAGINMWLNDRIGIGIQADYLVMPYSNIANSWQGTARVMWRLGGKSKRVSPVIQYVDRVVEKVVEVEKLVDKPVYIEVPGTDTDISKLQQLFAQLYFEFDRFDLTPESETILDNIADILKQNTDYRFLITGQTDMRGSSGYNLTLSRNRANTVLKGLTARGVPAEILKSRGIGKEISVVAPEASDDIRRGERKVIIELITNMGYWEYLK